ncbi:O-acetyl-ADP-ribose deacetylase [Chryseolinea soli]|uniref:O-acetyl-ADP-ribose deacetylase n=1 Tax=Chryseolinea soli TaxID=2321403 RepID=A0A385SEJ1_9BACT|nr:O-acetyl-ADP-ribose deacetylase [Chryseolinea soli]AYB30123.1 O-acetyl-ADP-ribose deacetylase [Chryseolinea soli]
MTSLECIQADITTLEVDAIVNAANTSLLGGGGVDGAIHRKAGPQLLEECRAVRNRQGGCPTGEAVITGAGRLPAKFVIHAVGPVWRGTHPKTEELLASAYRHSLELAAANHVKSIAFPNISTGIYGFPKPRAAEIAIAEVTRFLETNSSIQQVLFVCFDEENFDIYKAMLGQA